MVQKNSPTPNLDSLDSSFNENAQFNIYYDVDYMAIILKRIIRIMQDEDSVKSEFSTVSGYLGALADRASVLKELMDQRIVEVDVFRRIK